MILINGKPNSCDINHLTVSEKNFLSKNLEKGYCVVVIPEFDDNGSLDDNELNKVMRKYKLKFLYNLFLHFYPDLTIKETLDIISSKYHFFVSYRQMRNILFDGEQ